MSELDLSSSLQDNSDGGDGTNRLQSTDKVNTGAAAFEGKAVVEWSCEDVAAWLNDIGLAQYGSNFVDNEICGEHLAEMTKEDLRELGIVRLGHRLTITNALQKLQK